MSDLDTTDTCHILRPKEAAAYLGISRSTLYRISETDPDFPHKITFSKRWTGWRKSSLEAYVEKKEAGK